jgi:hypothetical protein
MVPTVHALHVVEGIVASRKPMACARPVALLVVAEVRSVPMAVHTMVLALVAKKARSGRELDVVALLPPASEGLDV